MCAVHPYGVDGNSCEDFELDPTAVIPCHSTVIKCEGDFVLLPLPPDERLLPKIDCCPRCQYPCTLPMSYFECPDCYWIHDPL
jgi:hypothetical protein